MASPKKNRSGRRRFLQRVLSAGGAAWATGLLSGIGSTSQTGRNGSSARWAGRLGLQVYTVRDRLNKEFEATIAAIAEAGYKEVELFGSLGERTPRQIRAILDRNGLTAPSTHITVSPGPDLEKQLEAWRIIGHRFTAVRVGPPRVAGAPAASPRTGPPPQAPPITPDTWRRQAAELNEVGRAGQKYGVRALVHNHTEEFAPMGDAGIGYDILLDETDPSLVAMELDIGWARLAGQDPIAMFKKHPGRYPLWHVKDTTGLAATVARPFPERRLGARFVPIGAGDIDYKALFAMAATAGLQHFFVEQDNAVEGDSLAAIRTSAQYLKKILS
jgi:sugar phosphate isomerase/epimerase